MRIFALFLVQVIMLLYPTSTDVNDSNVLHGMTRLAIPMKPTAPPFSIENFNKYLMVDTITTHIVTVNKKLPYEHAQEIAMHIYDASTKWDMDPLLITSLIHYESTFNCNSVNGSTGAIGLTQIYWKYHSRALIKSFKAINKREDLLVPKNSIYAGTWILWCYLQSQGTIQKALSRYCPGDKSYVKRVLALADSLSTKHEAKIAKIGNHSNYLAELIRN